MDFQENVGKRYAPNCANENHPLVRQRVSNDCFPFRTGSIIDMIIANIIKKSGKVGGIDIIIANISLEKNNGFSVKCWQKICTKFCKLSLQIAFFQLLRGSSPSDTRSFSNGQKFIMPIKQRHQYKEGGRNRHENSQYFIGNEKWFSVKCWQKVCTNWVWKLQVF